MRKYDYISVNEIRHYLDMALNGKTQSVRTRFINKMKKLEEVWRKRANSRIRRLQKAGYGNIDLLAAARFTTFKKKKNPTEAELYAQLLGERMILTRPTTLREVRKYEMEQVRRFKEETPQLKDWSDSDVKDFWNWVGRTSLQDYLDFVPDSFQARDNLMLIFNAESYKEKVNDLLGLYDEYKEKVEAGVPELIIDRGLSGVDFIKRVEELAQELKDRYDRIEYRRR